MIKIQTPVSHRKRIPLTPLIDVIFILIMFFLLSSSFGVWRPLDISLGRDGSAPQETQQAPSRAPSVLILVRAETETAGLTVNGVDLELEALTAELNRLAALGAEQALLVPGKETDFQRIVRVLDEARASRLKSVSLQLE
ncbi:ExbD/TolR family protein [Roseibium sp. M-1]